MTAAPGPTRLVAGLAILKRLRDLSDKALRDVFRHPLPLAERMRERRQKPRGRKAYSPHAPGVECIGKGKTRKPREFAP